MEAGWRQLGLDRKRLTSGSRPVGPGSRLVGTGLRLAGPGLRPVQPDPSRLATDWLSGEVDLK